MTKMLREVCPLECDGWRGTPMPLGFSLPPLYRESDRASLDEHWKTEHPDASDSQYWETWETYDDEGPIDPLKVAVVGVALVAAFVAAHGVVAALKSLKENR